MFFGTLLVMAAAVWIGMRVRRIAPLDENKRHDFNIVVTTTLTLLGLLIAFSFSMAASRYDQRKNFEEAEANAIGTAWLRCDLLAADERAKMRDALRQYVGQRIRFYTAPRDDVRRIDTDTARLQAELWSSAVAATARNPTPVNALLVASVNEVINAQGFTLAAWRNRIPVSAGVLMAMIAFLCNALVGYGARSATIRAPLLLVLPLIVASAFMLIDDMDAPRHGFVLIAPKNLASLEAILKAP